MSALALFFFAPVAVLAALALAIGHERRVLPVLAPFAVGLCLACLATAALHTR